MFEITFSFDGKSSFASNVPRQHTQAASSSGDRGTGATDRNVPRYSARFRSVQGAANPPEIAIAILRSLHMHIYKYIHILSYTSTHIHAYYMILYDIYIIYIYIHRVHKLYTYSHQIECQYVCVCVCVSLLLRFVWPFALQERWIFSNCSQVGMVSSYVKIGGPLHLE